MFRSVCKMLLIMCLCAIVGGTVSLYLSGALHVSLDGAAISEDKAIDADVQRSVAMHEAGHAIVSAYLCGPDSVKDVATNAELDGGAFGATTMKNRNKLDTADDMLRDVAVFMGGRAGDVVVNGGATNGAGSDLRVANDIVWNMHLVSGLGGSLLVQSKSDVGEEMSLIVEHELDEANECAEAIVTQNRDLVVAVGEETMKQPVVGGKRTLSGDAVRRVIKANRLTSPSKAEQKKLPSYCRQYAGK